MAGHWLPIEDILMILSQYDIPEEKIVLHATRIPWSDYAYRAETVRWKLGSLFEGNYTVGDDSKMKTN